MGAREVAAGAAWLDENWPGWEREIDLGSLDVAGSCEQCILGQSLRRFVNDRWENGWTYGNYVMDSQKYAGFLSPEDWADINDSTCNGRNEPFWVELVKERFATGNLSDTED